MGRKKASSMEKDDYFLSPTIDSLFKRMLADMRSPLPLASMLSAILKAEVSEALVTSPRRELAG